MKGEFVLDRCSSVSSVLSLSVAEIKLRQLEVSGLGDLEILCRTWHHSDDDPGSLQQAGLISAGEFIRCRLREGPSQQSAACALWRLRLYDSLARNGCGHDRSMRRPLHLLDRIHRGQADDRGADLGDGIDR